MINVSRNADYDGSFVVVEEEKETNMYSMLPPIQIKPIKQTQLTQYNTNNTVDDVSKIIVVVVVVISK